jgi:hypothetical protein
MHHSLYQSLSTYHFWWSESFAKFFRLFSKNWWCYQETTVLIVMQFLCYLIIVQCIIICSSVSESELSHLVPEGSHRARSSLMFIHNCIATFLNPITPFQCQALSNLFTRLQHLMSLVLYWMSVRLTPVICTCWSSRCYNVHFIDILSFTFEWTKSGVSHGLSNFKRAIFLQPSIHLWTNRYSFFPDTFPGPIKILNSIECNNPSLSLLL